MKLSMFDHSILVAGAIGITLRIFGGGSINDD
jgi:hypothetical protein